VLAVVLVGAAAAVVAEDAVPSEVGASATAFLRATIS
jgi:hypothetical protein